MNKEITEFYLQRWGGWLTDRLIEYMDSPKERKMMNHLNWNHIMDKQPEHDEIIIQCDYPSMGVYTAMAHYPIRMTKYYQRISWDELIKQSKELDLDLPDFYWISAKNFPFPLEVDDAP